MVYGGKPSRGCRTCRARRIKCDEGKPTCKRCEKSKRECGGYRPEFEIVHRDQTKSTLRRLHKGPDPQHQPSASARPIAFVQEEPGSWRRQSSSPSPEPSLAIPLAHRASCYFASNFILVPLGTTPHGFMEYLVPLMEAEPPGSALRFAFNACAFALLGNRARAEGMDLSQLSLKEHTLALAQTHKALSQPALASTDSTLAAVLLLCLYENITAIKETRMLAWRSHIDGAVHIIKTRGREEMCRTRMGTLLFTAVKHHLVSRVLSSGLSLPFGVDWWMSVGDTGSLFASCQRFALGYSGLRTEVNGLLSNAARSPEFIAQARQLTERVRRMDGDIASWLASIPAQLRFKTVCWVPESQTGILEGNAYDQADVYPGRVDVYPDFVTAMAWNVGRVSRLILASLDIRLAAWIHAPADYRTTPEYENARRICEHTISEIIASVPYHLGWRSRDQTLGPSELSGFACGEEGTPKALPALFLIWSLTCVKNHDICTEDQRAWVKGRLKFIATEIGLKYAHIVNEKINIRFPSMMINRDGMMSSVDPLQAPKGSGYSLLPALVPRMPESVASRTQSPSSQPSDPAG
ncbi:white-opaque regulator 1 [Staphylotrichum tortipilum]|uniref:White-opaque regulator 1 n=1 Tax=Staphylotrichum tortipilum TaxID=2831512 RepID=A0AAN6MEK8_9PEZI|nr:white-opaque regulator 1 [Staphylotrichum longicolle]